jgi:hypothetical protein
MGEYDCSLDASGRVGSSMTERRRGCAHKSVGRGRSFPLLATP